MPCQGSSRSLRSTGMVVICRAALVDSLNVEEARASFGPTNCIRPKIFYDPIIKVKLDIHKKKVKLDRNF